MEGRVSLIKVNCDNANSGHVGEIVGTDVGCPVGVLIDGATVGNELDGKFVGDAVKQPAYKPVDT